MGFGGGGDDAVAKLEVLATRAGRKARPHYLVGAGRTAGQPTAPVCLTR